jgi:integrase
MTKGIKEMGENVFRVTIEAGRKPTGERNRLYFTVHGTKRYAEQWRNDKMTEIRRDGYKKPSKMTVKEYLAQWYEFKRTANMSEKTLQGYEIYRRLHVEPEIGGIRLEELEPLHIQQMYVNLAQKGLSPSTVRRVHSMVHLALKQAVKWQMLRANPSDSVDKPRNHKHKAETLPLEAYSRFLEEAAKSPAADLILFALHTSIRRGEVLALRWKDVDLTNGAISVLKAMIRLKGKTIIKDTKTNRSQRPVVLTAPAVAILRRLSENKRGEYVFMHEDGRLYDPSTLTHQCKRVLQAVGLDNVTLHGLRHTHATWLLKRGVHPKIVQERLGHASISTTLDIYSHVIPSMQREAVDAFEQITESKWLQNGDKPRRLRKIK